MQETLKLKELLLLIEEDNTDHKAQMKRNWSMSDAIHQALSNFKKFEENE